MLAGIAGVTAHFIDPVSTPATVMASFTPLTVLAVLVAVILLAVARRWIAVILAAAVTAVGIWSQVPLYRASAATVAGAHDLRLMQANIMLGQADPTAIVDTVRAESVDVLTVIELTDSARAGLQQAGLDDELPYAVTFPRAGGGGAGIYSRYPLEHGEVLPGFALNNVRAELSVPAAQPITMFALHPLPPWPEPAWRWASELDRLRTVLASERQTILIGADFNSTFDHKRFRDLLAESGAPDSPGLVDAAEHTGAGIVATFPANRTYPAVLAIDRILTRGATPVSFRRIDVPGSDHHGVIGDVLLDGAG